MNNERSNLPLISVIVPVYNVENYLEKSIKSITEQTYTNLEIILVDDGSTDNSGTMCDNLENEDNRIRVIHKKNGGQGSARNKALDVAKGEYYCFLDSDDTMKRDCIEYLYYLIVDRDVDVAVCNCEYYNEEGELLSVRKKGNGIVDLSGIETINSMWSTGIINIAPWAKIFKKELWQGIRFKEIYFTEDFATMHFVYEKARKVCYSYKCGIEYLVRLSSSNRTFNDNKLAVLESAEDNIRFAGKYTELLPAARQKAVSVYFHIMYQLPNDAQHNLIKERLKKKIKELRPIVIKDKKCIKKTKYALILSYISFDLVGSILNYAKKRQMVY